MKLQNDYKIIYEKVVDGKRHLFASKESIPSEANVEVKYDSLTEDQVKAFKLIYEAGEGFKGAVERLPGEADQAFALTDGAATILAGDEYKMAEQSVKKAARKAAVKQEVEIEAPTVVEDVE